MPTGAWTQVVVGVATMLAVWLPIFFSMRAARKSIEGGDEDGYYTFRQWRGTVYAGIAGTVLFLALFLWGVFIGEWATLLLLPFVLLFEFMAVYCLRWEMTIGDENLRIRTLFKQPFVICIDEIDRVQEYSNGMRVFSNGKKVLNLGAQIAGYEMLEILMRKLGKLPPQNLTTFAVRVPKVHAVLNGIACAVLLALLVRTFVAPNQTRFVEGMLVLKRSGGALLFEKALLAGMLLLGVYELVAAVRWRIRVDGRMFVLQKSFAQSREMPISDITEVVIKRDDSRLMYLLMHNGTLLTRVRAHYIGTAQLMQRLRQEAIPFYQNGKLLDMHGEDEGDASGDACMDDDFSGGY